MQGIGGPANRQGLSIQCVLPSIRAIAYLEKHVERHTALFRQRAQVTRLC